VGWWWRGTRVPQLRQHLLDQGVAAVTEARDNEVAATCGSTA
jgi:hypothetical protein